MPLRLFPYIIGKSVDGVASGEKRMGKTGVLGSFEEMVLLAILRNHQDAYAVTIRRELQARSGADVAIGAVYATLDRLEEKGLVGSEVQQRAGAVGRPRRYYDVVAPGHAALAETRAIREAMWQGLTVAPHGGTGS